MSTRTGYVCLHDGVGALSATHLEVLSSTALGTAVRLAELAVRVATPALHTVL